MSACGKEENNIFIFNEIFISMLAITVFHIYWAWISTTLYHFVQTQLQYFLHQTNITAFTLIHHLTFVIPLLWMPVFYSDVIYKIAALCLYCLIMNVELLFPSSCIPLCKLCLEGCTSTFLHVHNLFRLGALLINATLILKTESEYLCLKSKKSKMDNCKTFRYNIFVFQANLWFLYVL